MSDRLHITYKYFGNDPKQIAEAIRVEQTIEFPFELAASWIQETVVGKIEEIKSDFTEVHTIIISYNSDVVGADFTQFLNVLWGNASLIPGLRVVNVELPTIFLSNFKGPRFGITGLRNLFNSATRPLLTTALKPMGSDSAKFAKDAAILVEAGFDMIKDDHSLTNQPWSTWNDRVKTVAFAVNDANSKFGKKCLYAPSLNLPFDQLYDAAFTAKEFGAGALLILPGITGFDSMRVLAEDDDLALPIQAHPSMLGSLVTSPTQGIGHGIAFGLISRLAGADITIFPNFGGRFSFSPIQCAEIREASRAPLGSIRPNWIAPAGGMTIDRIPEMVEFYGNDTALLVGGALHRGELFANAKRMVDSLNSI